MKHQELRNLFEKHFSLGGIKKCKNYSVINEGFPGSFNLSFSEPEMIEEFGSLVDINHKLYYTKIQPCIRLEDFTNILLPLSDKSKIYLSLFDMAGIFFLDSDRDITKIKTKQLVEYAWDFLISELKLDPKRIFIKCFNGGRIIDVTNGKYKIKKQIEKDTFSINEWIKIGIPKRNIILDNTRDTLLTLYVQRPTPWGYRNEVLYKMDNGEYLDIATLEYFLWKPIFEKNKIVDIAPWEHCCCGLVFGLERLSFLINKFEHIRECDHIKLLFQEILKNAQNKDEKQSFLLTECIRTSQRILTDSQGYDKLSRHRKKKLTKYIQQMFKSFEKLEIPQKNLKKYLKINALSQSWYPELKKNVNLVDKELVDAFSRKF